MTMASTSAVAKQLMDALRPGLRALAERGSIRHYPRNCVMLHEGDEGQTLFVLLRGRAKMYSIGPDGREITYGHVQEGDYFAEEWLDGGPRATSVMALEPCICSLVGPDGLRQQLAQEPGFALDIVSQVIRRARSAIGIARKMALLDVYGRTVDTLESLEGPATPDRPVMLTQITHQQIAACVGASREMVSRVLKELEKGGFIELGIKRVTLKKKLPARW